MEEFPVLDLTYLEGLTQLHKFGVMLHFLYHKCSRTELRCSCQLLRVCQHQFLPLPLLRIFLCPECDSVWQINIHTKQQVTGLSSTLLKQQPCAALKCFDCTASSHSNSNKYHREVKLSKVSLFFSFSSAKLWLLTSNHSLLSQAHRLPLLT